LLFSVCFGLALAVGPLPGALAWLFFPFASTLLRPRAVDERRDMLPVRPRRSLPRLISFNRTQAMPSVEPAALANVVQ